MSKFKILVVGAGPVGATFALLAQKRGVEVALIDARACPSTGPSTETRSLALSHGSRVLLERAGAWQADLAPAEIHTIHTSQQNGFGRVRLSRDDADVPALGYVVGYAALQGALDSALAKAGIAVTYGARVESVTPNGPTAEHANIQYTIGNETCSAQAEILVLADGGANLDKLPSITTTEKDYGQSAMLATVQTDRPHQNIAYERFTPDGPLALLPYQNENEFAMVWVAQHDRIQTLMALDEAEVRAQFQRHFGSRAGQFLSLTKRRSYPLRLRQASARVTGHVAIIGNAAQAMHPVAGQGFNLGLRDAQTLAGLLGEHPVATVLTDYNNARQIDVSRGVGFTDLLASVFLADAATLRMPRGLAMAAVDMLPFARRMLARRMLFGMRT